jgi:hypothetical protein
LCRRCRHELERAPVVGLCAQADENIKRLLSPSFYLDKLITEP